MDDFDTTFDTPEEFNSIFSVDKELIDPISDETEATSQRNTFSTTLKACNSAIFGQNSLKLWHSGQYIS